MPLNITDARSQYYAPQYTQDPEQVTVDAAGKTSGKLSQGLHTMVATVACWYLQGGSSVSATTAKHYLPANTPMVLAVEGSSDQYVGVIRDSSDGKLIISPRCKG